MIIKQAIGINSEGLVINSFSKDSNLDEYLVIDLIYSLFENESILFCGDTLFSGGCGRVFEGTYEQMFNALKKLSEYPKNTKIFCGHEYTLSNLEFAKQVDPKNEELKSEYIKAQNLGLSDIPTLPSNLKKELKINPFLRCGHADIKERIIKKFDAKNNDLEIFTALRKWKDNF